ncbi:MAG: hypothetical protein ACLSA6_10200 [Holdemania massiliensis]
MAYVTSANLQTGLNLRLPRCSVSLAVGYLLGGVLGTIHFQLAFNVQAAWMILLGLGTAFFVEDSIVDPQTVKPGTAENGESVQFLRQCRSLMSTVMILFLIVCF